MNEQNNLTFDDLKLNYDIAHHNWYKYCKRKDTEHNDNMRKLYFNKSMIYAGELMRHPDFLNHLSSVKSCSSFLNVLTKVIKE